MKQHKLLLILTLAVMLLLVAIIWFYPPTGDFRTANPFWNGLATFTIQFKASELTSLESLPKTLRKETVLIIIPYEQFTETELEQLRNYTSTGGTLIILDDYGYGNQILSYLGLEMRFSGKPLLDPLFSYKNKWLPKATNFTKTQITNGVNSIVLNHASTLSNTSDATILAWSSRFSFLDINGNSSWDPEEPTGPLPIAAYAKIGEGNIIVIADPSILINSMINMDDNLVFIGNAIHIENSNPKVLVDQSHLPKASLDEAKNIIATVYSAASSPLGALSLIVIILALTLNPLWRKE
jgi:hypothetical protein